MSQTISRRSGYTEEVLPKSELKRIMKRFMADQNRGISLEHFAEIAGMTRENMALIFVYEKHDMSEIIQRRVSKAYKQWLNGELVVMQNKDRTKFVDYRKEPKPRLARGYGLQVVDGEIKLKLGIRNKAEYSETLDEQLDRG